MNDKKDNIKPLNVNLPTDLVKRIKVFCAQNGMTIRQFVQQALEGELRKWEAAP